MIKKLTGKNFLKQVTEYGFFAEQFPECFSSKSFADNLSELLPLISTGKKQKEKSKNTTAPTTLSTYKNDISRRVLSVANPEAFLRLAKYISDNWKQIVNICHSSNSLSPIFFYKNYSCDSEELINCESIREMVRAKSDYITGIRKCIRSSLGFKYRLKVDISNCYNSFYTHSVTWAVCGKESAKSYFRTHTPASLKTVYEMGDTLDCFVRQQKNNETNGIIVGPYTSRIISEIILARIDKMLSDKGFKFKRYVDDYKFFFRTEAQAQESLPTIEKVLNEFNLTLNTAKTQIDKYPYEIVSQIKDVFDKAQKSDGVFGVLNAASQLHLKGEKGAYKYALKYIKNSKTIYAEDFGVIIPTLINIMLLDPRYGKYVADYIKKNIFIINTDTLTKVLNTELFSSLKNELQQESLMFVQLIHDLGLNINADNLIRIIESDNDFAIIIALDIWKHHKSTVNRTKQEARKINDAIKKMLNSLQGETLNGSRWLLLYELRAHELVSEKNVPSYDLTPFFQKMLELKISFYK